MICKYCGTETTSENGICKACSYKLKVSPNQEGVDIFSSSGGDKQNFERFDPSRSTAESSFRNEEIKVVDFAPVKSKKRKLRKGFVAIVTVAAAFIVVILLWFGGAFDSGVGKIKESLAEGDYIQAEAIFKDRFTKEGSGALNKMLEERLDSIYEGYISGEREYTDAKEELDTIEKMGVTDLEKKVNSVGVKLKDLKKSKAAYDKADKYYGKKNYALSIKEYDKVIKDDPNYQEAKTRRAKAVSNYRNTLLSEAASLVANGDYTSAVKLLESCEEILGKDKLIQKRITEYSKNKNSESRKEVLDASDEHAYNENYAAAITVIMTALEQNKDLSTDETVMNNLEEYRKSYTEQFSEKIDEYISDGMYEEAAELLEEADRVIPKSKTAKEKKEMLEGRMPRYLHEFDANSMKNWHWGEGESVDAFGRDHSTATNCVLLSTKSIATYDINGDYESFKCSFVAAKGIDESVKCKVEITATVGGEYLYREVEISADTEEQEITMITEHCSSLTISISGEGAKVLMCNARLTKD